MTSSLNMHLGALEISDAQLEAAAQHAHIGPTQIQSPLCHHIHDGALEGEARLTAGPTQINTPVCHHIDDGEVESAARVTSGPSQINAPFCHH